MATPGVVSGGTRRLGALEVAWLVIGLTLTAAALGALFASTRNDRLAAYNAAPTCATIAQAYAAADCRYTTTATVTDLFGDTAGAQVWFDLEVSSGASPVAATLPGGDSALTVGEKVQVEVWESHITKVAGIPTTDNPASDPALGALRTIGLLLLPLGLGAAGWGIVSVRRRSMREPASGPNPMNPVAISDVLFR